MKRLLTVLCSLAILGVFAWAYKDHVSASSSHHVVASAAAAKTMDKTVDPITADGTATTDASKLTADMNAAISSYGGLSAAATLVDLSTGQEYDAGATTTVYKAASTAKVLAAVDYLHEVEQGNASLTQTLDGMTAQQALQQMIEISDNDAWAAINSYLGDQQQSYAASLGLRSFTGGDYNTMTARDEAKLLALVAEGKLLNSTDRALLYGFMANTDSSNLIPAALPASATIYHKYGQLWGDLHDAAIVQLDGHSFVLVIYTNNPDGTSDDYADQVSLIQAVTTVAWQDISG